MSNVISTFTNQLIVSQSIIECIDVALVISKCIKNVSKYQNEFDLRQLSNSMGMLSSYKTLENNSTLFQFNLNSKQHQ